MYRTIILSPSTGYHTFWHTSRRRALDQAKMYADYPGYSTEVCKVRDRNDDGGIVIWREPIAA